MPVIVGLVTDLVSAPKNVDMAIDYYRALCVSLGYLHLHVRMDDT